MARPLRVEYRHALYHVTCRGNEKHEIYRDDHDFARRLDWLARTGQTYGWRLHGFVLMPNHDHLFVETPDANLSAGMQYLDGSYASYFNARHRRVGHVFQGRYKAILIEDEGHYFEVSRYVHLNPVRAGLVTRPEQWPSSSYPGYHRIRQVLPWVTYSRVLGEFGRDEVTARKAYRRFIAHGLEHPIDSPLRAAVHGLVLGSDRFVQQVRRRLEGRRADPGLPQQRRLLSRPPLAEIVRAVAANLGVDRGGWVPGRRSDQIARGVAAYLARDRFGYSATETAKALGYAGPSSVAMAIRRVAAARARITKTLSEIESTLTIDY